MSTRTIHFPPAVNGKPALPPAPPPGEHVPAIVIWGRMMHMAKHLNDQLKHLPEAVEDYHGTLRVLVTAALAIEADAKLLLVMMQAEGGGSALT
jgi:hypothetical protein